MRYRFIRAEKAFFPVLVMCRVLQVSRSGFYAWNRRAPSRRERENERLGVCVRAIHSSTRGRYGSPRVYHELRARGERVGRHRVSRIMRREGLRAIPKRRFRVTTKAIKSRAAAPNLLNRDFTAQRPNERWTGDITFIWTGEGWLYLAVLLDLFSRRVVGWATSRRIDEALALKALRNALLRRPVCGPLIHHTDRGSTYSGRAYLATLARHYFLASMSRKADCWDNAVTESFFATLKKELVERENWATRAEAEAALLEYIEWFYNLERRHSTLGYVSPAEFELTQVP